MGYSKLNKNSKKSWFIARSIITIMITATLVIFKWFLKSKLNLEWIKSIEIYINIGISLILILLLLNTIVYPFIEYKQWRYEITEDKVDFIEGIFFTNRTIVPILRIQYIRINQGPINKFFKLADISITTAGGVHKIPNIDINKAEKICDSLKDKIKTKVELADACK